MILRLFGVEDKIDDGLQKWKNLREVDNSRVWRNAGISIKNFGLLSNESCIIIWQFPVCIRKASMCWRTYLTSGSLTIQECLPQRNSFSLFYDPHTQTGTYLGCLGNGSLRILSLGIIANKCARMFIFMHEITSVQRKQMFLLILTEICCFCVFF